MLDIEDASPNPLLLTTTHLAFSVKVPYRLRQKLCYLRPFSLQHIPHVMRAHNVRLPTFHRFVNAQKTNKVTVIDMKELSSRRPVYSHFVDLHRIFTDILHMPQNVSAAILRDKITQICPQPHVSDRGFMQRPLGHGKSLEENEPLAIQQVFPQIREQWAESRKREVLLNATHQQARQLNIIITITSLCSLVR